MDHLNHRLNEISSRLDHLERLALQIQRDNSLNHEELKQYISATFNLIHSSLNSNSQSSNAAAVSDNSMKATAPGYPQEPNHRLNGSASFDLLVPSTTSPYLGSSVTGADPSNDANQHNQQQQQQQQQQQPQLLHSQYSLQQPVQRVSIFNQQLGNQAQQQQQQLFLPTGLPITESHLQQRATQQHQQLLLSLSQQQKQQQLHLNQEQDRQLQDQDHPQEHHQDLRDKPTVPSPVSEQADPKTNNRNSEPHDNIPLITIKRSLSTVEDIWREYYYGLEGNPSIRSLDAQYGRLWRDKQKERTYFRRKKIFGFIERYMDFYNCNEAQAIEYLENYRKDSNSGKKKTLMWLYTHMPSLPNES